MGRKGRKKILKIRYRKPGKKFGTRFSLSKSDKSTPEGRVLYTRKLGYEQAWGVGEYLPFKPSSLLRELQNSPQGGLNNA